MNKNTNLGGDESRYKPQICHLILCKLCHSPHFSEFEVIIYNLEIWSPTSGVNVNVHGLQVSGGHPEGVRVPWELILLDNPY